ncbi:hypothetical protein QBC32DRAFT_342127 [Pseudoneurospora amorphoporcata]|uniref:Endonuclease/exonuclease/phosphatase domain-containing protein n=1 Tax=Pseudoneurospora amorphoporcata TaxID=241081 RepID=A0AAN6SFX1_9PEZI|nr:hypothetical protein QBC32DRAFT_342127 [Pseudoneurospora amorphoporcata]
MKLSNALTSGALVAHAAAATSGDFTILTMNVAGLPAILNPNGVPGGKEASAKTIGSKFAQYGYDVIHMQEVSYVFRHDVLERESGGFG